MQLVQSATFLCWQLQDVYATCMPYDIQGYPDSKMPRPSDCGFPAESAALPMLLVYGWVVNKRGVTTGWSRSITVCPQSRQQRLSTCCLLPRIDGSQLPGITRHTEMSLQDFHGPKETMAAEKASENNSKTKGLLCHYASSATIHGVSHLGEQPYDYHCRRGIWSLLVLLMASSLFLLIYFHVERYASRPFVTIVNAHVRDSLPFPAVTICNLNQFHRERVPRNDPRVVALLRNLSAIKSIAKVVDLPPVPRDQFPLTGERLMEIAVNASHKLNDLFMICIWKTQPIACDLLFHRTLTDLGFCFTFNSHLSGDRFNATDSRHTSGLQLLLNIEQDKSYYSKFTVAGVKVLFHEPEEVPLLINKGVVVGPGTFTAVAMRREKILRLPPPFKAFGQSYCLDTKRDDYKSPLTRYQNYSYTKSACWQNCFAGRMAKQCGCRYFFEQGDDPLCSIDDLEKCYLPYSEQTSMEDNENCNCSTPCEEVHYLSSLSSTVLASTFVIKQLINSSIIKKKASIRDNLIHLEIHYETLTESEIYQKEEMTVMSILGDVGGHMGLCMGASFLSVIELLEVGLLFVCRCLCSLIPGFRAKG